MIDAIPTAWLLEQGPPWIAFIIALLTRPATWSDRLLEQLPGDSGRDGGS